MKKQYIQPALVQIVLAARTFVAASLQVSNEAQNGVSGDVKEYGNQDNASGSVNVWDEEW